MGVIARYRFNSGIDTLPTFNSGFVYTQADVNNGDNTITRTIESDALPTSISFSNQEGLLEVYELDTTDVDSMTYMFYNCTKLTALNTDNFNTTKVTAATYMFFNCTSLTELNVSSWNVSNIINMQGMFYNCNKLTRLDVGDWEINRTTTMSSMFYNCSSLTELNVGNWNVSKVNNMGNLFNGCSSLARIDVGNWIVDNVSTMGSIFYNCSSLVELDVSNWNVDRVSNMSNLFNGCNNLTKIDVSNWNTNSVTDMSYMFNNCGNLTELDLSGFNTNNVTNMRNMFNGCLKLAMLDISNWNTDGVTNIQNIFNNCNELDNIGMLYSNKATCENIRLSLPNIGGLLRDIYVQDTKADEYINDSYVQFKDYHCQQIEIRLSQQLNRIGDVVDKLYWNDNRKCWCIEQRLNKITFDGSDDENINYSSDCIIFSDVDYVNNFISNFPLNSITWGGRNVFSISNLSSYNVTISTLSEARQWLSTNPITIVYQLGVSNVIELTDLNLPIRLYQKDTTKIEINTDIVKPSLVAIEYRDIK